MSFGLSKCIVANFILYSKSFGTSVWEALQHLCHQISGGPGILSSVSCITSRLHSSCQLSFCAYSSHCITPKLLACCLCSRLHRNSNEVKQPLSSTCFNSSCWNLQELGQHSTAQHATAQHEQGRNDDLGLGALQIGRAHACVHPTESLPSPFGELTFRSCCGSKCR